MIELVINVNFFIVLLTIKYELFGIDFGINYLNYLFIMDKQIFHVSITGIIFSIKKDM